MGSPDPAELFCMGSFNTSEESAATRSGQSGVWASRPKSRPERRHLQQASLMALQFHGDAFVEIDGSGSGTTKVQFLRHSCAALETFLGAL